MAFSFDKIADLGNQLAENGKDLNNAREGGGDYAPPEKGQTRVRLVGYIENGVHQSSYKGAPKIKPRATLLFELSGKKHEPRVTEDGRKIPTILPINEVVGDHIKNGYMKLFKQLNSTSGGQAKNFVQLLGKAWLAEIFHREVAVQGQDKPRIYAGFRSDAGYSFRSTTYEDPETEEVREIKVDAPLSAPRVFLWDNADLEQWDSLFIDGTYDDGGSKNKFQEKIKSAQNFKGSPIYDLLVEAGRTDELVPAKKVAADDAEQAAEEALEGDGDAGEGKAKATPAAKPGARRKATKTEKLEEPAGDDADADPLANV